MVLHYSYQHLFHTNYEMPSQKILYPNEITFPADYSYYYYNIPDNSFIKKDGIIQKIFPKTHYYKSYKSDIKEFRDISESFSYNFKK